MKKTVFGASQLSFHNNSSNEQHFTPVPAALLSGLNFGQLQAWQQVYFAAYLEAQQSQEWREFDYDLGALKRFHEGLAGAGE